MPEGWNAVQRDLNKNERRGQGKVVMFHKAKESLYCLDGEALNRLPREAMDIPSLEVLKARLGEALVGGFPVHGMGVGTG